MIKAVIFDVGGVLAYDVWEHLLCDPPGDPISLLAGCQVDDSERDKIRRALWEIGEKLWKNFDRLKGDPHTLEEDYWQQFKACSDVVPELKSLRPSDPGSVTDAFIRPVNEAETTRLLEWLLSRGICLGICSNNNEFWSRRQMEKLNLYRFFAPEKVILSCHYGFTKSDYRLFQIAAHSLGFHPRECAFVDDRMGNISRAIDCGMAGLLFPTEQFPSKPQRGAQYLLRMLEEILR
jgi:FMN phosphatase YigB (HAD superfamily)